MKNGPAHAAQQEAILAWTQEIAPYGMLTTDVGLRIQSWNQWLETHSGFPASAVIGQPLLEIFPTLKTRRLDEPFHRALGGESSVLATALHDYLLPFPATLRERGVPHMLQTARIGPLLSGKQILGTITIIEDVTQREFQAASLRRQQAQDRLLSWSLAHLLQSRAPLTDVLDLFPKIAATLELELYFCGLVEPGGDRLRLHSIGGFTSEEREAFAVVHLDEALAGRCAEPRACVLINDLQTHTEPRTARLRALGVRACVALPLLIDHHLLGTISFGTRQCDTIVPAQVEFLSTIAQYVAIAIERDRREQALREAQTILGHHAEALELKVAERTARLHDTIAQLESFSYTVAHDLRAPIRALRGYCEVLSEDYAEALPPGGHLVLGKLHRATNRLDALTRDLLKFSTISRQEVELTRLDVAEVVNDVVLSNPALQDGIVVVQSPLGVVWGQRTLFQQCLSNLFDNAVKFAPPGVSPRIVIRAEQRSAGAVAAPPSTFSALIPTAPVSPAAGETAPTIERRLRLWIEDNGIGIEPAAQQRIFDMFERIGGPDAPEGTGIGLAIVARAMQQMRGACGVESTLGQGSRFWLDFVPADDLAPA